MSSATLEEPDLQIPFVARWAEPSMPVGSKDMTNPDTSTENKSTEDYDT